MNANVLPVIELTFEQVLLLAQRLPPADQARLVVRLAPKVEWLLNQIEPTIQPMTRVPLRGLLTDLGTAPSAEDIDEAQQEMWPALMKGES